MSESLRAEADSCTDNSDKEVTECPTCGKSGFKNIGGMRKHHYQAHGERLHETLVCDWCGEEYELAPCFAKDSSYCSQECQNQAQSEVCGEKHPLWNRVDIDCAECGKSMQRKRNEYELYNNLFCSEQCRSEYYAKIYNGENHPNWKDEVTGEAFYQTEKWRKARIETLKRDKFTCQGCGEWGTKLHVHHIHPIADGGAKFDLNNLVTFCMSCHNRWEGLYLRPDTRNV